MRVFFDVYCFHDLNSAPSRRKPTKESAGGVGRLAVIPIDELRNKLVGGSKIVTEVFDEWAIPICAGDFPSVLSAPWRHIDGASKRFRFGSSFHFLGRFGWRSSLN